MKYSQKYVYVCFFLILSILACQSSINSISREEIEVTKPEEFLPTNFLKDPNTACAMHLYSSTTHLESLSCLDSEGWHIYEVAAPIYWIDQCPGGQIYINVPFEQSIYMLDGETFVKKEVKEHIGYIHACGLGNEIWTGYGLSNNGISRFDGSEWTYYPLNDNVISIAVAPDGLVWVSQVGKISTFDGDQWQVQRSDGGNYTLDIDTNGNVWAVNMNDFREDDNDVLLYDGVQWSIFVGPRGYIADFALDRENRIWVVTADDNIYVLDPKTNSWGRRFSNHISYDMQFDGQGRLWVATDYGLYILDGSGWTAYHMHTADLFANSVHHIFVTGDGPTLPDLMIKETGSLHGKMINPDPTTYTNMKVEICTFRNVVSDMPLTSFFEATPCTGQDYSRETTVGADGNFEIKNILVGKYYFAIQKSESTWSISEEFTVNPGEIIELGEIVYPPETGITKIDIFH
jgi:hypothetical protein